MAIFIPRINIEMQDKEMTHDGTAIIERHKTLLEPVMKCLDKNIAIHYKNSEEIEKITGGDKWINVFMWSAYEGTEMDFPEVNNCYGKEFCPDGVFEVPEECVGIGDTIKLLAWDEARRNLFFLYDVCEYMTNDEEELMGRLIHNFLLETVGNEEEMYRRIMENENRVREAQTEKVLEKVMEGEREKARERQRILQNDKDNLRKYRQKVRDIFKRIQATEALSVTNENSIDAFKKKLKEELEIVTSNAKITKYEFDDEGNILLHTVPIICHIPDCPDGNARYYFFGEYTIRVDIGNGEVRFFNKDPKNRRKSCWSGKDQHPHVSESGKGCLGSCAPLIADCIDTYQWGVLADILVNYLESVNLEDSAGKKFFRWDECDEKGNIINQDNRYEPRY